MFVNKSIDPGSIQIVNHSGTFQTLILNFMNEGRKYKPAIHNIYLLPMSYAEEIIPAEETTDLLERKIKGYSRMELLLLRDFNAWHSDWFGRAIQTEGLALRIKELMNIYDFELILPLGTVTRPSDELINEGTTLDLIWGTKVTTEHVVEYDIRPQLQLSSDHIPVSTVLGYKASPSVTPERWNFKAINTEGFLASL